MMVPKGLDDSHSIASECLPAVRCPCCYFSSAHRTQAPQQVHERLNGVVRTGGHASTSTAPRAAQGDFPPLPRVGCKAADRMSQCTKLLG